MKAIVWLSSVVLVAAQKYRANNVIVGGAGRQTTPLPHTLRARDALPAAIDWRSVNGTNFATPDMNQFVPEYCGACWAHAAAAALSDRIKIARGARWPDVLLSRQVLLNCLDVRRSAYMSSCNGGDPYTAYDYIAKHAIPDETCAAYVAGDQVCTAAHICKGLDGTAQATYPKYSALEYGAYACEPNQTTPDGRECRDAARIAAMEHRMMAEVALRGPIACCTACGAGFDDFAGGGVYEPDDRWACDHIVSVSGYGADEDGQPYWLVRNSFGRYWGDQGWYKLPRGRNAAGIEQYCAWAVPDPADWS